MVYSVDAEAVLLSRNYTIMKSRQIPLNKAATKSNLRFASNEFTKRRFLLVLGQVVYLFLPTNIPYVLYIKPEKQPTIEAFVILRKPCALYIRRKSGMLNHAISMSLLQINGDGVGLVLSVWGLFSGCICPISPVSPHIGTEIM
jgi:hypothetical protein